MLISSMQFLQPLCPIFSQVCMDFKEYRSFKTIFFNVILGPLLSFLVPPLTWVHTYILVHLEVDARHDQTISSDNFSFYSQCVLLAPSDKCCHFYSYVILYECTSILAFAFLQPSSCGYFAFQQSNIHYYRLY